MDDRLELISLGRLPNGVTVAKMREGMVTVARNELLREILRGDRYIEHQGMVVRDRITSPKTARSGWLRATKRKIAERTCSRSSALNGA